MCTMVSGEERMLVPILQCGELYSYTIPSFSVITVEMRRIKYQVGLLVSHARPSYEKIKKESGKQPIWPMSLWNVIFIQFQRALIGTRHRFHLQMFLFINIF